MSDGLSFRALQLANEQRNAYGLRYHDFARYRKHCANRTHRIRSTLKMTHGKGRDFKKLPPLNEESMKDGHLQLLLMEAERAWAYSQDLVSQSLQPTNVGKAHTLRHSATGRFRRSVNWSTQLLSHCQVLFASSRLSAESLLETTIYTLILNGRFLRYREDFEDALIQLSVARHLLDELAAAATTSRNQALAVLFADEIGPEVRYCAHELGREKSYDVDGIVSELSSRHKNALVEGCDSLLSRFKAEEEALKHVEGKKKLETLMWEGEPVPVRNPELVDVFLKVQEAEKKLDIYEEKKVKMGDSKKSVAAYDAILLALSDAEDVARRLKEAQQSTGSAASTSSGTRDMHFLYAYTIFQLLSRRIQRDFKLVKALLASPSTPSRSPSKPRQVDARVYPAIVKLLDTIMQGLNQMRTLSIVDDNPDLSSGVDARISYTKASRCLYLAPSTIRETQSHISLSNSDIAEVAFFPLSQVELGQLESQLSSDSLQFKRDWFAYNGGSVNTDPKSYKKPAFFNIALNYVDLDMDRLLQRAGKESAPTPASAPAPPAPTTKVEPVADKRRIIEDTRAATPEPAPAPAVRGGLSSLLGGWWGKN
ncbi:uncharacterized protein EV420DRAFT_1570666 [Desarmillaria tabescens]|uniref:Signal recognition particle subunit SRP68 n=1 Tax=Armillaria tabescens TaxID=1929756 RepID=A0AA39JRD3_ARMTA|nr:uncharacterized protein EV420DRAFT_1570666 [Desarmillaria tabescens]KAK0446456.1 hypothetical protein EV420DRAFT_1570666 [Desarmillaria tabescens]